MSQQGRHEVIGEPVCWILGWSCVLGNCSLQMAVKLMRIRKQRTGTVPSKPEEEECQGGD